MEGNKPKQQREKPVDKRKNLNLNEVLDIPVLSPKREIQKAPDYRPQSFFTRRQISKAKRKKLRKIAKKSRQVNRHK